MSAQIMDGERPDGGPHDGMRETQHDDAGDGEHPFGEERHADQCGSQAYVDNQGLALRNHLRDGGDAH